jgi:glutamine amidotransferase
VSSLLLDYGMGNLRSVEKACAALGSPVTISSSLAGATKVIVPGVGAFAAAMENLRPLAGDLRKMAEDGVPILGICLGQQLFFESSDEFGYHEGLGLLPGRVVYFPKDRGLKVPHMGWSPLQPTQNPLLEGVVPGDHVYFVHSLYTECDDEASVAAWADYIVRFPAAICRRNVWATQFHPEKSGSVGLTILKNFLSCS